ncbi:hypothetical protein [Gloeothece verrucosa]|uniref:Uncharacterized protein n=1 Tax=Gloeothece verrucosa (strain PCC 7822) TaxID=497965 RepID=E0ULX8_GLOV7|nr:hypothetical protein [Gloeothece verrucosa]ADN17958.1 conserved hypothetical protein [Gloeothece verrucosa PCC 7822]
MTKTSLPETTTRAQLRGYGASEYLAIAITKTLTPIGKEKVFKLYSLKQVVENIREYLKRSRIAPQTRLTLTRLLEVLSKRLQNVIPAAFGQGSDPALSQLSRAAHSKLLEINTHINKLKGQSATIKGKSNARRQRN